MSIYLRASLLFATLCSFPALADDRDMIIRASLDYLESQHSVDRNQMQRALHPALKKRTFWRKDEQDTLLETDYDTMLRVAERYNRNGDRFPDNPRKSVKVLDIHDRIATVKVEADEWLDYMHLVKVDGEWKIVNVLWQYYDAGRHQTKN
ncbi:nuclear transport factor 2 family protein [Microbulbifer marinus]|uniref:Putative lumazine-binding n=1 Tax=Microbulbifer marinus TaxID=658218 RepID=A0A1H4A048_9GAMM|nr:nuclear transport factor 2 family protein [Microbulbifer marinus]SEA29326.1 Putative lumazine-binding [Microbulbifer marinus]